MGKEKAYKYSRNDNYFKQSALAAEEEFIVQNVLAKNVLTVSKTLLNVSCTK